MMLKRAAAALMAALCILAAGCSKSGKELHLYTWAEYFPDEVIEQFGKEFGVKVTVDNYPSNEDALAKLRAGGAQYDVVVPSTYAVKVLANEGLLQPIDHSKITNLKNVGSEFMNRDHDPGNKYSVPYMWGAVGIAYNTKYVKTAPKTWADVLSPEYKNRIVALDDSRDIIGIGLQSLGFSRNETDPGKVKAAQDWLQKLMPNIKAWDSDNPKAMLIAGDAWIGLVWNGDASRAMAENKDIKFIFPQEKGLLWLDSLIIPKAAPNPQVAHDFINYILRPEVGAKIALAFPYGSANAEAVKLLPEDQRNSPVSYPPKAWVNQGEFAADLGEKAALFDKTFTELKAMQ